MKKYLSVLLFFFLLCCSVLSQDPQITGKPVAEIFTDFHYTPGDTSKNTGFGVNRAHLGYNFIPGGNFSSEIIINIGSPDDLAAGSEPKRYAFFREASLKYATAKLTLSLGMVSTRIFNFQQGFWGKRYLGPEYQAIYGYGSVADLGVVIDYKLNDILKADLSVLNGEGYSNIQVDNSLKTALGITITTQDRVAFRLYGDISRPRGIWQSTLIAFAGLKNDFFSFGAEGSYKTNLDLIRGHDVWGVSATGSLCIKDKSEVFARYDYTSSLKVPDGVLQWDYEQDGTLLIGGIQHTFNNYVKMALNYRRTNPYSPGKQTTNAIYLNALFRF